MNDQASNYAREAAPIGYSALIFVITYITKQFNVLFVAYILLMGMDYATGLIGSFITCTWNSKKGLDGILKKLGYIIMVILAFFVDLIILQAVHIFNEAFTFADIKNISFGTLLLVFLCGNEFVSILENLKKCDITIPIWILAICKKIRDFPTIFLSQEKYKNILKDDSESSKSSENNSSESKTDSSDSK